MADNKAEVGLLGRANLQLLSLAGSPALVKIIEAMGCRDCLRRSLGHNPNPINIHPSAFIIDMPLPRAVIADFQHGSLEVEQEILNGLATVESLDVHHESEL